ncbi:hypothetical protein MNBD_NITROSPINAE03-1301, partial [hydrothermal vent metagenome]
LLAANAPAKAEEPAEPDGQDDIDALLAANAPAKAEELAEPDGQDDIDALLAANAPAKAEEPAEPDGQDDIDALLAANAPAKAEEPAEEDTEEFDIDDLLASGAPEEMEIALLDDETDETAAHDAGEPEARLPEDSGSDAQEDIDKILSENSSGNSAATENVAPDGKGRQGDVDAIIAQRKESADTPEADTSAEEKPGELISQDDINSLLEGDGDEPEGDDAPGNTSAEGETDELISQDDIDSLIGSGDPDEAETGAAMESADTGEEEDLISQDDIDALLYNNEENEEEQEAGAVTAEGGEEELDNLLESETDAFGDDIANENKDAAEPVEEPAGAAGAMQESADSSADEVMSPEHVEEIGVFAEEMDENKSSRLSALLARLGAIVKAPIKILVPKSASGIFVRVAAVLLLASAGGSYWFFFGGSMGKEQIITAMIENATSEPKEEAAPTDNEEPAAEEELVDESLVEGEGSDEAVVNVGIYLPVEFDFEATRIMNIDIELTFDSKAISDAIKNRLFFTAVTIENAITKFFEDKFYEETIFVQDKLEEKLNQELKSMDQFDGLQEVHLASLTFE